VRVVDRCLYVGGHVIAVRVVDRCLYVGDHDVWYQAFHGYKKQ